MLVKEIIQGLVQPLTDLVRTKQERKIAQEAARAKLQQAKHQGEQQVVLNEQEAEALRIKGLGETWKDEYVTVSIVSILNLIVLGGILAAFERTELLTGVTNALLVLESLQIDFGEVLRVVVFAAVGVSVWRRL